MNNIQELFTTIKKSKKFFNQMQRKNDRLIASLVKINNMSEDIDFYKKNSFGYTYEESDLKNNMTNEEKIKYCSKRNVKDELKCLIEYKNELKNKIKEMRNLYSFVDEDLIVELVDVRNDIKILKNLVIFNMHYQVSKTNIIRCVFGDIIFM